MHCAQALAQAIWPRTGGFLGMYECMYVCMYACMHVRTNERTHACMYVLYTYIHKSSGIEQMSTKGPVGDLEERVAACYGPRAVVVYTRSP